MNLATARAIGAARRAYLGSDERTSLITPIHTQAFVERFRACNATERAVVRKYLDFMTREGLYDLNVRLAKSALDLMRAVERANKAERKYT